MNTQAIVHTIHAFDLVTSELREFTHFQHFARTLYRELARLTSEYDLLVGMINEDIFSMDLPEDISKEIHPLLESTLHLSERANTTISVPDDMRLLKQCECMDICGVKWAQLEYRVGLNKMVKTNGFGVQRTSMPPSWFIDQFMFPLAAGRRLPPPTIHRRFVPAKRVISP